MSTPFPNHDALPGDMLPTINSMLDTFTQDTAEVVDELTDNQLMEWVHALAENRPVDTMVAPIINPNWCENWAVQVLLRELRRRLEVRELEAGG